MAMICQMCGNYGSGYLLEFGWCNDCREQEFEVHIDLGSKWLNKGHTIECIRGMLELKPCSCGVIENGNYTY